MKNPEDSFFHSCVDLKSLAICKAFCFMSQH
ncbi:hypothetical protein laban61_gp035 [Flavobacterium phage vB_FspS_laban6-1]|uniref:Uncharacterized protein n=1 Tax=Flavobacterium phage vB_FspS_laban6-1 TaxID=2686250 RepID=A0A6B9LAP0_9CAUD|nr:hypothetical protein HWC90_gp35 [Flavobacterium phage vB_FspS_laban6-1]QHB39006.1 hypothetical protein laban61_gp035 [Flavobacterium phage vB_FspS_laban6-1]